MELTQSQIQFLKRSINQFHPEEWNVSLAGQAASQRLFIRLQNSTNSYILVVWDGADDDWQRFLQIPKELPDNKKLLPEIFGSDDRQGLILEEDLGEVTLKRFCLKHRGDRSSVTTMYKRVLDALKEWHSFAISKSPTIASRAMNVDTFLWETSYFSRHCVGEYFGCEDSLGESWQKECVGLAKEAVGLETGLIHRDFQSENILINDDRIRFVDYQGARIGPLQYDVSSLLLDPYISQTDESLIRELYQYYISFCTPNTFTTDGFYVCSTQRLMQALGAYTNLVLNKGKKQYNEFIPVALSRLSWVLEQMPRYPAIAEVVLLCKTKLEIEQAS